MPRGFILQPTYRIEAGRPVVHIFGKLESGWSFLIRDNRPVPSFFIRDVDIDAARKLGARVREDGPERKTLDDGHPALVVEVPTPSDAPPLRDKLIAAGIPCYEADVRFAYRYLIDRGIQGTLEIHGDSKPGKGVEAVFENPELTAASWQPELSVLSVDIETDPTAEKLLSIALYGCGASQVLLLCPEGLSCPPGATPYKDERSLLRDFVDRVREIDPDVITGWNVIDFDLRVLSRMAHRQGVPLTLGRGPEPLRIQSQRGFRGSSRAVLTGRLILDGIELLRGAFVSVQSYGLGNVARELLGKTKTISGGDRGEEILRQFHEDRERFVEYNLNDARLVLEILDHLHLIELSVERSRLTGMPPDRVGASIASFDFLYLTELGRRGVVAPSVGGAETDDVLTAGGHVLEPSPGLYHNVLIFDFKSLYPSIIRTFQIDPLGLVRNDDEIENPIEAPNGARFRRAPGILPGILDDLFPRRDAAKARKDPVASQAIKILMNSFYGVLATRACRFADPGLANAITGFGRELLLWTKAAVEERGHEVLYGDTDSLFVLAGVEAPAEARALGSRLVTELNTALFQHIEKQWGIPSKLELEFEKTYLRLLLPVTRGGSVGARKRYAGLVQDDGEGHVEFIGMEVVRRDWTELAKTVQREVYERLFSDRPVEDYIRDAVRDLRAGKSDEQLVYRKSLRKPLDHYTASNPPHVAAARKLDHKPGRTIRYLITTGGPEPLENRKFPIDHEHYVQKQIRPVVEPVLTLLDLDFDRAIGDDSQLSLF